MTEGHVSCLGCAVVSQGSRLIRGLKVRPECRAKRLPRLSSGARWVEGGTWPSHRSEVGPMTRVGWWPVGECCTACTFLVPVRASTQPHSRTHPTGRPSADLPPKHPSHSGIMMLPRWLACWLVPCPAAELSKLSRSTLPQPPERTPVMICKRLDQLPLSPAAPYRTSSSPH